ncbi:MAG: OmpA family protein [Bacteroidetes bacterium]|nr:OmpA family protein [Bacteroidota bacterium]
MSRIFFLTLALSLVQVSCIGQKSGKKGGGPDKKAYDLFGQALLAHDVREDDKALEILEKVLKRDPNYVDAYSLRGQIYLEHKQIDLATEALEKAYQIAPDNLYTILDLSNVYFEQDRYDDCLRLLNKALTVIPPKARGQVNFRIECAEFAKNAMENPVPFDPKNLGPNVNTKLEEYFPGLSTDETLLYFTSRDGSLNQMLQDEDIYVSSKIDSVWGKSISLGSPINTKLNEGAFCASPDGRHLLYASSREGGYGRFDIWITTKEGDKWTQPENLGRPINTPDWESQPSLSADGKTLFYVSNREDGYGRADIWYTIKTENGWSKPKNLGPEINTPGEEQFPFIHPDGKTLYFVSDGLVGMGGSDIYYTRLVDGKWTTPVNLGYPINTHGDEWSFVVNRSGDKAFFASDGLNGYGGMDIYSMDLYPGARPNLTGYVKGIVFDVDTKERLGAEVELFLLSSGDKVISTTSDRKNGEFLVTLPGNENYAFEARADGYLFHSENFSLKDYSLEKPFVLEIGLKKIKKDQRIVLNNVFFDVDKWDLKEESRAEMEMILDLLKKNPTIKVEIGGHTDNTGNEAHNKTLSENRAKAVYQYLIDHGIDATRLSYKGYASSQPIADNNTEAGRAKNRRTELRIVE